MKRTRSILISLSEAVLPVMLYAPRAAERVADRVLAQTRSMNLLLRVSFLMGLWLLELVSLLRTGTRLSRLSVWRRSEEFERWTQSHWYAAQQIGIGYNGVIFLAFYGLPEILEQLEFPIDQQVEQCRRTREALASVPPPQSQSMIRV